VRAKFCALGAEMAETQKSDQDRLIDETLSLFRNAIAETKTILPPVQFGRAVEHVPPSEPPEKRAASLISHAVSIARTVAGFVPKAVQTASPSLQPPVQAPPAAFSARSGRILRNDNIKSPHNFREGRNVTASTFPRDEARAPIRR
jgi:hypothetical protein